MLVVNKRCGVYIPGNWMSYDEGTARYNGRMSKYKHRQSWYKPYDGIRVYMLNDSLTGLFLVCATLLCLLLTNKMWPMCAQATWRVSSSICEMALQSLP